MSQSAVVVHHVPGRMRLRVAGAKSNGRRLQAVRQSLLSLPGVSDIAANSVTGTMVIQYDRALFPDFPRRLAEHGAAEEIEIHDAFTANFQATESMADQSIDQAADKLNQTVQRLTGNAINLKELFPFGILLYGVLFVDRATGASQWLSWVQFALSTYFDLHQEAPVDKVGASIETLRAEMALLHAEDQQRLEAHIASLHEAIQSLARHLPKTKEG